MPFFMIAMDIFSSLFVIAGRCVPECRLNAWLSQPLPVRFREKIWLASLTTTKVAGDPSLTAAHCTRSIEWETCGLVSLCVSSLPGDD
jgi:hypothetical protein